jgi:hypothetical protein
MHEHHSQTIWNVKEYFQRDPEVQALLMSGSIAHGFQAPTSEVDSMIFVAEDNYQKKIPNGATPLFQQRSVYVPGRLRGWKISQLELCKSGAGEWQRTGALCL